MKATLPLVPISLLAVCTVFAGVLFDEIVNPTKPAYLADATAVAQEEVAIERYAVSTPPPTEFAEIAARPLFVVARRPAPPPSAPVAAPAPPPPPPMPASNITVVGIVADQDKRVALLQPPNSSSVLYSVEGQSISGWQIYRILSDRVILRWNSTEQEITFPKPAGRANGPASAGIQGSLPMRPLPALAPSTMKNR